MIDIFPATVVFPGKKFSDRFHEEGRVVATFHPMGLPEEKMYYCRVKARPGSAKAERLFALRRGERVWLCYIYRGEKSYFDLALIRKSAASLGFVRDMKKRAREKANAGGDQRAKPDHARPALPPFPPTKAYENP